MARMHTKRKGKSKSRKPVIAEGTRVEMPLSKEEVERLIEGYTKQGMPPAVVGERLKREHGILYPRHALGMRMNRFLKARGMNTQMPEDLLNLMSKAVNLNKHISANRQDKSNMLNLRRTESKIWRLTKYYIRTGVLPEGWRYDVKQAELIIRGRS
jgi:small subunit ribosomal protein S15